MYTKSVGNNIYEIRRKIVPSSISNVPVTTRQSFIGLDVILRLQRILDKSKIIFIATTWILFGEFDRISVWILNEKKIYIFTKTDIFFFLGQGRFGKGKKLKTIIFFILDTKCVRKKRQRQRNK